MIPSMAGYPINHVIWLVIWAVYLFGVYSPSARRFRRSKIAREHTRPADVVLDMATFLSWQVLPLIAIFSGWLDFANTTLPGWTTWLGGALMLASFIILFVSYRELGANWSPKIDVRESQELVRTGIYSRIRHPIYLGIWLWALANPLLIHNWIAGPAMLVVFALLYFTRMPREEAMMLEHFGEAYRSYMAETGRLLPGSGSDSHRGE
jgi:protein-S-isoprenylcysteine O-methyltransferase Ste14